MGFRFFVQRSASARGLRGWVRNLGDGRVEAVAEGPRRALEDWLVDVRQGPRMSLVEGVDIEWRAAAAKEEDFRVLE